YSADEDLYEIGVLDDVLHDEGAAIRHEKILRGRISFAVEELGSGDAHDFDGDPAEVRSRILFLSLSLAGAVAAREANPCIVGRLFREEAVRQIRVDVRKDVEFGGDTTVRSRVKVPEGRGLAVTVGLFESLLQKGLAF